MFESQLRFCTFQYQSFCDLYQRSVVADTNVIFTFFDGAAWSSVSTLSASTLLYEENTEI